jgi:hypothetical protein
MRNKCDLSSEWKNPEQPSQHLQALADFVNYSLVLEYLSFGKTECLKSLEVHSQSGAFTYYELFSLAAFVAFILSLKE